jgi:hypothetical protein
LGEKYKKGKEKQTETIKEELRKQIYGKLKLKG